MNRSQQENPINLCREKPNAEKITLSDYAAQEQWSKGTLRFETPAGEPLTPDQARATRATFARIGEKWYTVTRASVFELRLTEFTHASQDPELAREALRAARDRLTGAMLELSRAAKWADMHELIKACPEPRDTPEPTWAELSQVLRALLLVEQAARITAWTRAGGYR